MTISSFNLKKLQEIHDELFERLQGARPFQHIDVEAGQLELLLEYVHYNIDTDTFGQADHLQKLLDPLAEKGVLDKDTSQKILAFGVRADGYQRLYGSFSRHNVFLYGKLRRIQIILDSGADVSTKMAEAERILKESEDSK